ncbi:enoyl-[acyl-carrier-protein] reductase FabK [candidate division KSB1 bacterium]|nr:MAG: enoyl-[acyl-carrier-protein] reductase FabK [candidate division KSB1 bacterium]
MKRTRICDLLGIKYPIIQGGMLWLATAELAAAVSNAGALGIISPLAGLEKHGDPFENFRTQINAAKNLTRRPFGVNIPLDLEYSGLLIDLVLKEGVGIVVTSAGSPEHYTELARREGVKVLHVVSSVRQAQNAESCNVDAVIAEGVEAAAHNGRDEIPLFSLIPQVADSISIPVIAAGGIVDARGVVAAICLGADGVQLGTRFVAVKENIASPKYKQAIINAKDTDTVITCRKLVPTRSLKTEFSRRLLELEESGASADDIRTFLGYSRARKGQLEGDLVNGEAYCGASAGLIKEILPAALVVRKLVEGYQEILRKLI